MYTVVDVLCSQWSAWGAGFSVELLALLLKHNADPNIADKVTNKHACTVILVLLVGGKFSSVIEMMKIKHA